MKIIELIENRKNDYVKVDLFSVKYYQGRVRFKTIIMSRSYVEVDKVVTYKKEKYRIISWEELPHKFVYVKDAAF